MDIHVHAGNEVNIHCVFNWNSPRKSRHTVVPSHAYELHNPMLDVVENAEPFGYMDAGEHVVIIFTSDHKAEGMVC